MMNFIKFDKLIINTRYIKEMYANPTDGYVIIVANTENNSSKIDKRYKCKKPKPEFIKFYKTCHKPKINEKNAEKIKVLENKIDELENAIKYLPMVSQEYKLNI